MQRFPEWWKPRKSQAHELHRRRLYSTHMLLRHMQELGSQVLDEGNGTLGTSLQMVIDFCNVELKSLHLLVRDARHEAGVQVTGKRPDTWISAKSENVKPTRGDRSIADSTPNGILVEREELVCPITQELFSDPVVAMDGFTYERTAITTWLHKSSISPVTGAKMSSALVANNLVRSLVKRSTVVSLV